MLTLFQNNQRETSLQEKILGLTDHAVYHKIPEQLRETGLFSEDEIARTVNWLRDYRAQHHLETIE